MKPTQFKDRHDKTWDININLGSAMLVDRSDFTNFTSDKIILSRYDQDSLSTIFTNNAVQFAVIGILVRNQCKENFDFEITNDKDEERYQQAFVESIDGPCMESARNALVEAVANFFPAAKTVLSTFLQKMDGYREKVSERLKTEILPMMDSQVDQMIDQEMAKLKESLQKKVPDLST